MPGTRGKSESGKSEPEDTDTLKQILEQLKIMNSRMSNLEEKVANIEHSFDYNSKVVEELQEDVSSITSQLPEMEQKVSEQERFEMNKNSNAKIFVTTVFRDFQKCGEAFNRHRKDESRMQAMEDAKNFAKTTKDASLKITNQLSVTSEKIGLGIRGHRDNSTSDAANHGDFIELLYNCADNDVLLAKHLESCKKNQRYTSKTIQNELLEIMGQMIRKDMVRRVKKAEISSILADEVTDAANQEQLYVCFRFVDIIKGTHTVCEEFVDFIEIERITDEVLATNMISLIEKLDLDLMQVRGPGYDGAANMFSMRKKLSKKKKNIGHHHYTKCPKIKQRKLKDMCRTRWVQRHEVYATIVELFTILVTAFDSMQLDFSFDPDVRAKAISFAKAMRNSEFIVAFMVLNNLLTVVQPLSINLQGKTMDVLRAHQLMDATVRNLYGFDETSFADWYSEAQKLAESVNDIRVKLRTTARQVHRGNHHCDTVEDYFWVTIFTPFLDHILSEMESRWIEGCLQENKLPDTISDFVATCAVDIYPNVHKLLKILLTVPVTTCEVEQGNSKLKLLKM
ncbi:52 kDa repressor of the inhibitor of the protein kinase-like [Watersipora subatra]|uniref:52 kDa repressor of the inhibitor of the protein kinase-like n=1 Tax=Watersipora subatra TaxID=2589382 RepID=UPI00355BB89B